MATDPTSAPTPTPEKPYSFADDLDFWEQDPEEEPAVPVVTKAGPPKVPLQEGPPLGRTAVTVSGTAASIKPKVPYRPGLIKIKPTTEEREAISIEAIQPNWLKEPPKVQDTLPVRERASRKLLFDKLRQQGIATDDIVVDEATRTTEGKVHHVFVRYGKGPTDVLRIPLTRLSQERATATRAKQAADRGDIGTEILRVAAQYPELPIHAGKLVATIGQLVGDMLQDVDPKAELVEGTVQGPTPYLERGAWFDSTAPGFPYEGGRVGAGDIAQALAASASDAVGRVISAGSELYNEYVADPALEQIEKITQPAVDFIDAQAPEAQILTPTEREIALQVAQEVESINPVSVSGKPAILSSPSQQMNDWTAVSRRRDLALEAAKQEVARQEFVETSEEIGPVWPQEAEGPLPYTPHEAYANLVDKDQIPEDEKIPGTDILVHDGMDAGSYVLNNIPDNPRDLPVTLRYDRFRDQLVISTAKERSAANSYFLNKIALEKGISILDLSSADQEEASKETARFLSRLMAAGSGAVFIDTDPQGTIKNLMALPWFARLAGAATLPNSVVTSNMTVRSIEYEGPLDYLMRFFPSTALGALERTYREFGWEDQVSGYGKPKRSYLIVDSYEKPWGRSTTDAAAASYIKASPHFGVETLPLEANEALSRGWNAFADMVQVYTGTTGDPAKTAQLLQNLRQVGWRAQEGGILGEQLANSLDFSERGKRWMKRAFTAAYMLPEFIEPDVITGMAAGLSIAHRSYKFRRGTLNRFATAAEKAAARAEGQIATWGKESTNKVPWHPGARSPDAPPTSWEGMGRRNFTAEEVAEQLKKRGLNVSAKNLVTWNPVRTKAGRTHFGLDEHIVITDPSGLYRQSMEDLRSVNPFYADVLEQEVARQGNFEAVVSARIAKAEAGRVAAWKEADELFEVSQRLNRGANPEARDAARAAHMDAEVAAVEARANEEMLRLRAIENELESWEKGNANALIEHEILTTKLTKIANQERKLTTDLTEFLKENEALVDAVESIRSRYSLADANHSGLKAQLNKATIEKGEAATRLLGAKAKKLKAATIKRREQILKKALDKENRIADELSKASIELREVGTIYKTLKKTKEAKRYQKRFGELNQTMGNIQAQRQVYITELINTPIFESAAKAASEAATMKLDHLNLDSLVDLAEMWGIKQLPDGTEIAALRSTKKIPTPGLGVISEKTRSLEATVTEARNAVFEAEDSVAVLGELHRELKPKVAPPSTGAKPAHEMTQAEYVTEYVPLARRVGEAEKTPKRKMSREETDLMLEDWEAYSRSRGYTEEEIADFRRFQELSPDKLPEEYATIAEMHQELVGKALRESREAPPSVYDEIESQVERLAAEEDVVNAQAKLQERLEALEVSRKEDLTRGKGIEGEPDLGIGEPLPPLLMGRLPEGLVTTKQQQTALVRELKQLEQLITSTRALRKGESGFAYKEHTLKIYEGRLEAARTQLDVVEAKLKGTPQELAETLSTPTQTGIFIKEGVYKGKSLSPLMKALLIEVGGSPQALPGIGNRLTTAKRAKTALALKSRGLVSVKTAEDGQTFAALTPQGEAMLHRPPPRGELRETLLDILENNRPDIDYDALISDSNAVLRQRRAHGAKLRRIKKARTKDSALAQTAAEKLSAKQGKVATASKDARMETIDAYIEVERQIQDASNWVDVFKSFSKRIRKGIEIRRTLPKTGTKSRDLLKSATRSRDDAIGSRVISVSAFKDSLVRQYGPDAVTYVQTMGTEGGTLLKKILDDLATDANDAVILRVDEVYALQRLDDDLVIAARESLPDLEDRYAVSLVEALDIAAKDVNLTGSKLSMDRFKALWRSWDVLGTGEGKTYLELGQVSPEISAVYRGDDFTRQHIQDEMMEVLRTARLRDAGEPIQVIAENQRTDLIKFIDTNEGLPIFGRKTWTNLGSSTHNDRGRHAILNSPEVKTFTDQLESARMLAEKEGKKFNERAFIKTYTEEHGLSEYDLVKGHVGFNRALEAMARIHLPMGEKIVGAQAIELYGDALRTLQKQEKQYQIRLELLSDPRLKTLPENILSKAQMEGIIGVPEGFSSVQHARRAVNYALMETKAWNRRIGQIQRHAWAKPAPPFYPEVKSIEDVGTSAKILKNKILVAQRRIETNTRNLEIQLANGTDISAPEIREFRRRIKAAKGELYNARNSLSTTDPTTKVQFYEDIRAEGQIALDWLNDAAIATLKANREVVTKFWRTQKLRKTTSFSDFIDTQWGSTKHLLEETERRYTVPIAYAATALGHASATFTTIMNVKKAAGGIIPVEAVRAFNQMISGDWSKIPGDTEQILAYQAASRFGLFPHRGTETVHRNAVKGGVEVSAELVKMGEDLSGSTIWGMKKLVDTFDANFPKITKELERRHSAAKTPEELMMLGRTYDLLRLWKTSLITGVIVPRPQYWWNNFAGDITQIFFSLPERGGITAAKMTFQNLPEQFPGFGRGWQKVQEEMAKKFGGQHKTLGSLGNSWFNPYARGIWNGEPGYFLDKYGVVHTYDSIRKQMQEGGILDTFASTEFLANMTRLQPEGLERLMSSPVAQKVPGQKYLAKGAARIDDWSESISRFASYSQQRMRGNLYMELIRQGYKEKEALRLAKEALYDWKHGVSQAEMKWAVARAMPFYRFLRLAAGQQAHMLSSPWIRPSEELRRAMTGESRLSRLNQLHMMQDNMHLVIDPIIKEDYDTMTERANTIARFNAMPNYMARNRIPLYIGSADEEMSRRWSRHRSKKYPITHFGLFSPPITNIQMGGAVFGFLGATAGAFAKLAGNEEDIAPSYATSFASEMLDQTYPWVKDPIQAMGHSMEIDLGGYHRGFQTRLTPAEHSFFQATTVGQAMVDYDEDDGLPRVNSATMWALKLVPEVSNMMNFLNYTYSDNPFGSPNILDSKNEGAGKAFAYGVAAWGASLRATPLSVEINRNHQYRRIKRLRQQAIRDIRGDRGPIEDEEP